MRCSGGTSSGVGSQRLRPAEHLRRFSRGISSTLSRTPAGLAQLAEHLTCNHEVVGSIPTPGSEESPAQHLPAAEYRSVKSQKWARVHEVSTDSSGTILSQYARKRPQAANSWWHVELPAGPGRRRGGSTIPETGRWFPHEEGSAGSFVRGAEQRPARHVCRSIPTDRRRVPRAVD